MQIRQALQILPPPAQNNETALMDFGKILRSHVNEQSGLAVVKNLGNVLEAARLERQLLSIARGLGSPMAHYARTVVYDVKPRYVERTFATFSETRDPADLHTDGTYKLKPPRALFLYCHKQSFDGGISVFADSRELARRLYAGVHGAEVVRALTRPFAIRVPDMYAGGASAAHYVHAPVLRLHPFAMRLRIDTIEDGLTQPEMTVAQIGAWELLKMEIGNLPKIEYRMEEGDLLVINNQTWLHGRSGFEGDRLVKRVWIH